MKLSTELGFKYNKLIVQMSKYKLKFMLSIKTIV
jgi:hypothetical protein